MTKGSGDTSSSEHDNVQGHDAQWPQRNSSSQLPTTSHTTSSAYDPVHDPDDEAGYGLHGISRSHQGAPSGRLQSSSDTHNQGSKTAPMVTKIQASTTLYKDNNRSKRPIRAISIFLILLMDSTFHFGSNKISIGTSFKISVKNTDELFYQMRAATARFIP
jgi:hypothetical protein